MRHFKALNRSTDSVKTDVGNVMLPATVKTATDLDMQVLNCLIQLEAFLGKPFSEFRRQSPGRRNAEFARIGAGTRDNVHDVAGTWFRKPNGIQRVVEVNHIRLADPADDKVLLHGSTNRAIGKLSHDVGQAAQLISGQIAQR